jgi:hypothetical protein
MGKWIVGLYADDTYGEICGKLPAFGLDEGQIEDIKALIDEYTDEIREETATEEAEESK